MKKVLVADVMTRNPVTVKPGENLLNCAKKMVRKKVGSLLLVDNKRLVGFIDQKDILWALIKKSKEDLSKIRAIDISPKKIATIKPALTIRETVQRMKKLKFERLPVIHEGKLVGIVTTKDILTFHPEVYPELEELAQIKEETKKLKRIKEAKDRKFMHEGICEECGNTDILYRVHGMLICESCKNSI
jgi:CBS domain-containing protein